MSETKIEKMMHHYYAVHDVVATAMADYAVRETGNPGWKKASFEFEADHVLTMLALAGYEVALRERH